MAVSFTWTIERLECRPQVGELENVVSKIHWRIFGFEGEVQGRSMGSRMSNSTVVFTPFDELTEVRSSLDARQARHRQVDGLENYADANSQSAHQQARGSDSSALDGVMEGRRLGRLVSSTAPHGVRAW